MREIARKVWKEQSAGIGFLASAALLVVAVANHAPLDAVQLGQIAAPFLVGVGARGRP